MLKTRATPRAVAGFFGLLALSLLSCGREVTGPGGVSGFRRAMFQVEPHFPTLANGVSAESSVPFERVRVTLRNPDGTIAKDTVVTFPPGADAVSLSLTILLPVNAPTSGVPLSVSMGYVNAAGDTVFKGGPFNVNVTPQTAGAPAPPPVTVPLLYTGVGSTAAGVRITPRTVSGLNGDQLSFTAVAFDGTGVPISGTPIVYSTSTPTIVSIPTATAPNAVLLNARGTGTVIAQLLTGQADTARITVSLKATTLALVDGGDQSAGAGVDLPRTIRVRITAPDGIGVGGIPLTIAVASGEGTVSATSATTSNDGYVNLGWKLGPIVGPQTLRVTAAGLTGSPLIITATATQLPPTALILATPPAAAPINTPLGTLRVAAQDAAGLPSPLFNSTVSVALGANPSGATLSGSRSRQTVNGVASFDDLTIDKPGNGYTLVFSANGLSSVTSPPFDVRAGSATRLAFTVGAGAVTAGVTIVPAVTVTALDASGNTATGFTGTVTLALALTGAGGGTLSGTTTRTATGGIATFTDLLIDRAGTAYTLTASAANLTGATSAPFAVAPAAATRMQLLSGGALTRPAGSPIDSVVAQVTDAWGNGVSGRSVTFTVKSGGGAASSAVVTTDVAGRAAVRWTLGSVSGVQTLEVASAGLAGSPLTVSATATAGAAAQLRVAQAPAARWTAGQATDPIIIHVLDADGNRVTAFDGSVTIAISSGPAASPIFGLTTVRAVDGVSTFRDLAVQKAGTYDFAFSSGSLRGVTATGIIVSAGTQLTVAADSGASQTGAAGSVLGANFVVRVADNYGNVAVGVPVTWAVTAGGGSLSSASGTTDENGRARTRLTLGAGAGVHSVTATAGGAPPATFTATASLIGVGTPTKVFLGFDNLGITTGVNTPINVFLDAAPPTPVTVTLSTLDARSEWSTSTVTIPAGTNSVAALIRGLSAGASRAVAAVAGLGADTVNLTVTQASIRLFDNYLYLHTNSDTVETRVQLNAPAPAGGLTVSFDLSSGSHFVIVPSLGERGIGTSGGCDFDAPIDSTADVQRVRTVGRMLSPTTVTIKEGETQAYLYLISTSTPTDGYVNVTPIATGYGSQTTYVDVYDRSLDVWGTNVGAVGQYTNMSVSRSLNDRLPFVVRLAARKPGVVELPDSVVIRAGDSSNSVAWTGLTADSTYIVASAPGFSPDSIFVKVNPPALQIGSSTIALTLSEAYPPTVYLYATDSTRNCYYCGNRATPLTVTASSSDPAVVVPSSVSYTIPARSYNTAVYYTPLSGGSAYIRYTAAGHRPDSILVTVSGTLPSVAWSGSTTVGEGQYIAPYLSLAGGTVGQAKAAAFTLTSTTPAVATADGTATLAAGNGSTGAFRIVGHTVGSTDITWSAAGFNSGTRTVTVTTPRLRHNNPCCLVAPGSAQYFQIFVADAGLSIHPRASDLVVTLTSTDTTVLKPSSPTVTIATGYQSTYGYVQPRGAGSASLILTAPGHTPDTLVLTVTGTAAGSPRINVANSMVTVGRRQYQEMSVPRVGDFPAARLSIAKRGISTILSDTAFNLSTGASSSPWFRISALATGTDTLIFTAPGHISDTLLIRVTTPRLSASTNTGTVLQNYPYGYLQISLTDSVGNTHPSMDTLRLSVAASDSNVARLTERDVMIPRDGYYFYGTVQFAGPGTSAYTIRDLASNYPNVTLGTITVQQPVLRHSYSVNSPLTIGMRQRTDSWESYVYTDYAVLVPTWIKLRPSAPGLVTVPDSVLIEAGDNQAFYSVIGRDTVGGLQLTATAPGFASAIGGISVSRPGLIVDDTWVYTADRGRLVEVVAVETERYYSRAVTENVRVNLVSDRPDVAVPDSAAVTIPAGSSESEVSRYVVGNAGTAIITATDPRSFYQRYLAGTGEVDVEQAYLGPTNSTIRLAPGQRVWYSPQSNFYNPDQLNITVTGTGGHTNRTGVSFDSIPANDYYGYSAIVGQSYGADTLTLTAPGFRSGKVVAEVSSGILALSSGLPLSLKVGNAHVAYFYLQTPTGASAESAGTTTITLGATNGVWDNGAGPITSVTVPDGEGYGYVTFKATTVGTATFTLTAPGYLTKTFTVQVLP